MQSGRSSIVLFACFALLVGCVGTEDPTAAKVVQRGRLKFGKGMSSLRVGERYVFRDTSHHLLINGRLWEPEGREHLADALEQCDKSPNEDVEILRCSGAAGGKPSTYVLRMSDDAPEVETIDGATDSIWIDYGGRWLLFDGFYFDVVTSERIEVLGLRSARDALGVSPDKKTIVVGDGKITRVGDESFVTLALLDTATGETTTRFASVTKYAWLTARSEWVHDVALPPTASTQFVWTRDVNGRDQLVVPETSNPPNL